MHFRHAVLVTQIPITRNPCVTHSILIDRNCVSIVISISSTTSFTSTIQLMPDPLGEMIIISRECKSEEVCVVSTVPGDGLEYGPALEESLTNFDSANLMWLGLINILTKVTFWFSPIEACTRIDYCYFSCLDVDQHAHIWKVFIQYLYSNIEFIHFNLSLKHNISYEMSRKIILVSLKRLGFG